MAGSTRYGDAGIRPRTNVYAAAKMLEHQMPVIILDKFADNKPMPRNKTEKIKFRRPRTFEQVDTPLVEGVTPVATQFRYEDVEGTLRQYGQVVEVTDHISDLAEDPVLMDASEQCGENIGRTFEALRWGVLRAGTNVFYGNGAARSAVTSVIGINDQRKVTRALKAQKAMKLTKVLSGSIKINTTPIEASYVAVGHTDLEPDIRSLAGFTPVAEYGSMKPMHESELGAVEDIRYCLSPDLPPFLGAGGSGGNSLKTGGNTDVYPILIFGKHAYGNVPLRGREAVSPSIVPVGQKDKSDPLGQRGYVGWKSWFLCLILNEVWMARLEVGASAL